MIPNKTRFKTTNQRQTQKKSEAGEIVTVETGTHRF